MTPSLATVRRVAALLLLPLGCMAQGLPPTSATWADSAKPIVFPLETAQDLVVVRLSINGSRPLRMLLDTGAPVMVIPDTALARQLGVKVLGQASVGGAGDQDARQAPIASGIEIDLGGLKVSGALAVLGIAGDVIPGVDGVVGAAIFQHAAVTMDWDARELRLQVPSTYTPPAGADVLALEVKPSRHVYVKGALDPDGRGAEPITLHLDTGARLALNVYASSFPAASRIDTPVRDVIVGWGSRGPSRGNVGRAPFLQLGRTRLENIVAMVPRQAAVPGDQALLGLPVLRRFRTTIDYSGQRLVLERTARVAEPFRYTSTGATWMPAADASNARVVAGIIPGSPADSVGLVPGDSVFTVNAQPLGGMSMDELRTRLLAPPPGQHLTLQIARAGVRRDITLRTRELLVVK